MQAVLGPDHPDVALSLDNLAELYDDQGRYADAEPETLASPARQFVACGKTAVSRSPDPISTIGGGRRLTDRR
jgi:hypothetical protein